MEKTRRQPQLHRNQYLDTSRTQRFQPPKPLLYRRRTQSQRSNQESLSPPRRKLFPLHTSALHALQGPSVPTSRRLKVELRQLDGWLETAHPSLAYPGTSRSTLSCWSLCLEVLFHE